MWQIYSVTTWLHQWFRKIAAVILFIIYRLLVDMYVQGDDIKLDETKQPHDGPDPTGAAPCSVLASDAHGKAQPSVIIFISLITDRLCF